MRRAAIFTLILAAVVPFGVRAHFETLREALSMRSMSMEQRKATMFAPWYAEVTALDRAVPRDSAIDFVMLKPGARDIAVLAGAILQPRDVRFFDGWDAWRARRRAAFMHDAHAVNAAPGPPPAPAPVVIAVDAEAAPQFRVVAQPR